MSFTWKIRQHSKSFDFCHSGPHFNKSHNFSSHFRDLHVHFILWCLWKKAAKCPHKTNLIINVTVSCIMFLRCSFILASDEETHHQMLEYRLINFYLKLFSGAKPTLGNNRSKTRMLQITWAIAGNAVKLHQLSLYAFSLVIRYNENRTDKNNNYVGRVNSSQRIVIELFNFSNIFLHVWNQGCNHGFVSLAFIHSFSHMLPNIWQLSRCILVLIGQPTGTKTLWSTI